MKSERGNAELGLLIVAALVILAIVFCTLQLNSYSCQQKAELMGFGYRYDYVSGCFYQLENGRWVDADAYYYEGQPRGE